MGLTRKPSVNQWDDPVFVLSSGREVRVVRGTIGIGVDNLNVGLGADEGLATYPHEWHWDERPWSPQERAEFADFMIARWQAFKEWRP